jgi:nitrogen fixation protein FixH
MDVSTDVALKNAWNSVIATAEELKAVSLDGVDGVDLEAIQPKVLAQANAAQALRGLVEELRRQAEKEGG